MASRISIFPYNSVPTITNTSLASGSITGTHSFLLVAFYEADETNLYTTGAFGMQIDAYGGAWAGYLLDLLTPNRVNGVNCTGNKKITFTWTHPPGMRHPHHYGVFQQTASAYLSDVPGDRVAVTGYSDGVIPAWKTSCDIESVSGLSTTPTLAIVEFDADLDSITVMGNHLVSFGVGTVFTVTGSTNNQTHSPYTVKSCDLTWTDKGICTQLFVETAGGGITAESPPHDGAYITYALGPLTFLLSTNDVYIGVHTWGQHVEGISLTIFANPGMAQQNASLLGSAITGYSVGRSQVANCPVSHLLLNVTHGGIRDIWTASGGLAVRKLNMWRSLGLPRVWIVEVNDQNYGAWNSWFGYVESINASGNSGKEGLDDIEIVIKIDQVATNVA